MQIDADSGVTTETRVEEPELADYEDPTAPAADVDSDFRPEVPQKVWCFACQTPSLNVNNVCEYMNCLSNIDKMPDAPSHFVVRKIDGKCGQCDERLTLCKVIPNAQILVCMNYQCVCHTSGERVIFADRSS